MDEKLIITDSKEDGALQKQQTETNKKEKSELEPKKESTLTLSPKLTKPSASKTDLSDRDNLMTVEKLSVIFGANTDDQQSSDTVFYAVEPLPWCPHLEELIQPLPPSGLDMDAVCRQCGNAKENWVCLSCYEVHCGRFVNQHMLMHHADTGHCLTLGLADLSVWCYGCDNYVHHSILYPILQDAHLKRFGENMPVKESAS